MKPQQIAQKIKAGSGWLIVRNSATLADTEYEHVADEIVSALNKHIAYRKLVAALVAKTQGTLSQADASALLREIGED